VDQAIGFFRVDFAVTFGDQNALKKCMALIMARSNVVLPEAPLPQIRKYWSEH
jgi:hypothetical protein